MIHAYDEVYLERAQRILGVAFDFAVNGLKIELKDFYWMFLASGYAKRMEYGDYRVIAGSSGAELVYNVTEASGIEIPIGRYKGTIDRSPEYWVGWALAYFQWYSAIKYAEIIGAMTIEEIVSLYNPYHEMDIKQFCDKMMEKLSLSNEVKLKKYRTRAG
ncbi:MAG: XRE family transcriptional regulator, partial [Firmicutes bacterium]|nr:XRE family transcriptional regulator [Bacillota bacterium]